MIKSNAQSELNRFFQIRDQSDIPGQKVTASAFCQARQKFSDSAFIELNQVAIQHFYGVAPIERWCGFRVLAVDGCKYQLPNTPQIHQYFGGQGNQHVDDQPMALGSTLYDVFQKVVVDALLCPYRSNEREIAFQHLGATQDGDLVLYDRGYPAFWLFAAHQACQRAYCMRVKADFNGQVSEFVASGKKQKIVTLEPSEKAKRKCREKGLCCEPQTVRLIRIVIKKKTYILITNLLDNATYDVAAFKDLYHRRWQIEEAYKRQKSWLEIENFSGLSVLSVEQDYHARILSLNLIAITVFAANQCSVPAQSRRKHQYQINFAQALSTMKDTLVKLLYGMLSSQSLIALLKTLGQALTAVRPDRRFERKKRRTRQKKFNPCYKRAM
jgi:hypothetical protein